MPLNNHLHNDTRVSTTHHSHGGSRMKTAQKNVPFLQVSHRQGAPTAPEPLRSAVAIYSARTTYLSLDTV